MEDLKMISTLHLTAMFCRVVFLLGLFPFYFPFPIYADLPCHPGVMPPVVAFAVGSASPANVPLVAPCTDVIISS